MKRFSNDYVADWPTIAAAAREAAGNRCVRCGHPFRCGEHGNGEWSLCDKECTHLGPRRHLGEPGVGWLHTPASFASSGILVAGGYVVEAQWRVLTIHHFDGDKSNNAWWNLLALDQRCHLQIQNKVIPQIPYFFEHSEWLRPYVAGFYARKYLGEDLTREQVMERLEELLRLELLSEGK